MPATMLFFVKIVFCQVKGAKGLIKHVETKLRRGMGLDTPLILKE